MRFLLGSLFIQDCLCESFIKCSFMPIVDFIMFFGTSIISFVVTDIFNEFILFCFIYLSTSCVSFFLYPKGPFTYYLF
jgi:hypothetical protein